MTYDLVIKLIFLIITVLLSVPTVHFTVFALVGLFAKKTYPQTSQRKKYGVVICARNEEKVIANLIESVKKNNYPQQLLTIFVVAHNCTDSTAQKARNAGAVVYEYSNPDERTKGYALKRLFQCIAEDYGIESFDGFLMLDADNILADNFIEKLNDAFVYYGGKETITSFRNSKNFGQNVISGLYGLHFASGCRFESRGRTICGCSARIQGTGFLMPSDVVKDGWKYVTLTEDWEYTADQILQGRKIRYCDDAMFFDEQPSSVKIMLRQRLRWAKGCLLVFATKSRQLFCSLFKRKTSHKGSAYDILACIVPYTVIGVFCTLLQAFLLSPLFGVESWGGTGSFQQFVSQNWLWWAITVGGGFLLYVIPAILLFVVERKRIKNVSLFKKILIVLFWPLFNLINMPLQLIALFKKVEWKAIPHEAAITHDALNGSKTPAIACEVVATTAQQKRAKTACTKGEQKVS